MKLEGKVALVTGGGSGIGLAIARRFVQEGAHVFITGRREALLAEAVTLTGGRIEAIAGDLTSAEDVARLFDTVQARAGRLDILVNSSGVAEPASLEETSAEHFDRTFGLNVRAMVFTVQHAVKHDGRRCHRAGGIDCGQHGQSAMALIRPAKPRCAPMPAPSSELAPRGIRVNTLSRPDGHADV